MFFLGFEGRRPFLRLLDIETRFSSAPKLFLGYKGRRSLSRSLDIYIYIIYIYIYLSLFCRKENYGNLFEAFIQHGGGKLLNVFSRSRKCNNCAFVAQSATITCEDMRILYRARIFHRRTLGRGTVRRKKKC